MMLIDLVVLLIPMAECLYFPSSNQGGKNLGRDSGSLMIYTLLFSLDQPCIRPFLRECPVPEERGLGGSSGSIFATHRMLRHLDLDIQLLKET